MGLDINFYKIKKSYTDLGYFRKTNFLVAYFENYFNTEIENLQDLEITKDSIENLIKRCDTVLKDHDKANLLLPTKAGYFFGSTDYDDYYFEDVKEVKKISEEILPTFDELDCDEAIIFNVWY